MYELKKVGKVFTSKFVGTGPSSYKKNLPGRGLTEVEKHWTMQCVQLSFPREKGAVMEVNHSSQSTAEAKNEWSCNSTSPIHLHGADRENLHLSFPSSRF